MLTTEIVARAYVNHGRLLADCPFCGGAEMATGSPQTAPNVPFPFGLTSERLFCGFTGNTCEVVIPPNIREIWELLERRPDPRTRNWYWHESIDDLRRENAEHGVG